MPMVVPVPLAGMATEIGTADDALLELEMERIGNYLAVGPATGQSLSSTSWETLTGWPNFQATLDVNGCLVVCGLQFLDNSTSILFEYFLSVDGAIGPVQPYCLNVAGGQGSGQIVSSTTNLVYFPSTFVSAGAHTFTLEAELISTSPAVTTYNPYVAVLPL